MRRRARQSICPKQSVRENIEVLDRDRLHPEIERARLPRGVDARFDQAEELIENAVLQGDRQREDPVEPAVNRRKVVDHRSVWAFDPEPSQFLELRQGYGFELAGEQQGEPAVKRLLGVCAFEIVGGIEQVLPTGLALAAGQRAETVEPPGDRRDEPALTAHIGSDRAE